MRWLGAFRWRRMLVAGDGDPGRSEVILTLVH
jgi:hypothetical protein